MCFRCPFINKDLFLHQHIIKVQNMGKGIKQGSYLAELNWRVVASCLKEALAIDQFTVSTCPK